jgi:hypothetical protein
LKRQEKAYSKVCVRFNASDQMREVAPSEYIAHFPSTRRDRRLSAARRAIVSGRVAGRPLQKPAS